MKNSFKIRNLFFTLICVFAWLLLFSGDYAQGQYLNLQKKNPTIEEMVGKISIDEVVRMHDKLVSYEVRNTFSDTVSNTNGVGAARRWIYSEFNKISEASGGRLKVYYDWFEMNIPDRESLRALWGDSEKLRVANVVALLPGKTDDLRYIINGHYDTRARDGYDITSPQPGANDDASGTIITMELARVLSQYEFDHTLLFVANIDEEHGLTGANHMAQMAVDEGWEIGGVIADDIIGNIVGGNGIINDSAARVFSQDPVDSKSRHWARYCKFIGEPYAPELKLNLVFRLDRYGRGGDHSVFVRRGFPGIRFTELNENFAHQHGVNVDLTEFMSREYVTKVARIQAAIMASAGLAPRPVTMMNPSRDRSDYSTRLRWTHQTAETDVAGYQIFIRKTDSGYWQEIIDVGMPEKQTTTTGRGENRREVEMYQVNLMHRSIDDYIFGIAAYDNEGNISIVSTYEPPGRE